MGQVQLKVTLLRYTPDPQELVAMASKLCYSDADMATLEEGIQQKDQKKFLEKLIDMGHLSPIEHASFTFGVEGVSRSLLAQLTRHRVASFSVQSQRYVGKLNREGCFGYVIPPSIEALGEDARQEYIAQMEQMQAWYNDWVDRLGNQGEKSNEDARFVLPNACETRLILTMNARELLHFFSLRCCNRAQWEIRQMAWEMLREVDRVAPALFLNAGPGCINGPCPEGKKCCGKMEEVRKQREELRADGQ